MRKHFFRRVAFLLLILLLLSAGVFTLAVLGGASLLGLVSVTPRAAGVVYVAVALTFIGIAGGITAAFGALRRTAEPVGDVMEAATRVADGDYSARVEERGPGEVRQLARAFNIMTERLQEHEAQRRALLADISHELRTPLSVIQGRLEGLLDGVYPRDDSQVAMVLEESRVLARLIEDLRTLAVAEDAGLRLAKTATDLGDLAREVAASFRTQAEVAGVQVRVTAIPDLPTVQVDPERIRQVLNNLIANALRYTPTGGQVEVTCARQDATRVVVTVRDNGAGISPEDLPRIFERFYKSADSRGAGLGLAIAKRLVEAHGGEISAESAPGTGTSIRLHLPIS
jgi:signal transduction histidine kinase